MLISLAKTNKQKIKQNMAMMTSSNGNGFRFTGPLWGESAGQLRIPSQRASNAGFDVFFDVKSKQTA